MADIEIYFGQNYGTINKSHFSFKCLISIKSLASNINRIANYVR